MQARGFFFASCCCLLLVVSTQSSAADSDTKLSPTMRRSSVPDVSDSSSETFVPPQSADIAAYCANFVRGKVRPADLQAVCEFALSLRWKLPNVIGEEERNRYEQGIVGEEEQSNKITAKIRYEDGEEQYTQVKVNGKAVPKTVTESLGIWSEGEFARDLRSIFLPDSAADFRFVKEDVLRSTPALIFDFKVERRNNRLLALQAAGKSTFPGYHGRLWLNRANSHLMRLEWRLDDVEKDFPMQQVNNVIEYGDIALGDGTHFVLPVQAYDVTCPTIAMSHCWHDRITFKHWQKFAARTRIVAGDEGTSTSTASAEVPGSAILSSPDLDFFFVTRDVRRGADITAEILRYRIAEVDQRQRQIEAEAARAAEANKAPANTEIVAQGNTRQSTTAVKNAPDEPLPVIKTSVGLVLVPTVVKNSQGKTVDTLQKANFRLYDDRRPQAITQFSLEHAPVTALERSRQSDNMAAAPSASAPGSRFAVYVFDDIHDPQDDLNRARDAAKRHLTQLRSGERAAILTLSGSVVLDFTNDAARINDALQHIQPHPLTATGSVHCPDLSYAQADLIVNHNDAEALAGATSETLQCMYGNDPSARVSARRTAQSAAGQVLLDARKESQASFNMLKLAVRGIAKMPGQRTVVLVSSGFPLAELEESETEIIDDALRAGVMINVLDPSGLSTKSPFEYGTASTPLDVLVDLSSGSGGVFFHNRNDMDEGFQKTSLAESFYVLGFSPQKRDGKFHKLKVELQASEKLSVQARRGYYAPKQ